MNKFCHLSLHSEYSINDGLVSMDDLAQKTSELGYESVAITDNSNLFGFVNFYQTFFYFFSCLVQRYFSHV